MKEIAQALVLPYFYMVLGFSAGYLFFGIPFGVVMIVLGGFITLIGACSL